MGRALWLGALCMLVACGPGVSRELERPPEQPPPPGGENPSQPPPPGEEDPSQPPARNPAPLLSSIDSEWVDAEAKQVRLRVVGSGFLRDSVLNFKGAEVPFQLVSDTELVATLSMEGLAWSSDDLLQIRNPSPGGGAHRLLLPYPTPVLLGISPDSALTEPGSPLRVRLTGRNFVTGGVLRFRSEAWPVTVLDTGTAEVELPTSALATASPEDGDTVVLTAPGPRMLTTAPLRLRISDPEPRIEGVWPPTLSATAARNTTADGGVSDFGLSIQGRDLRSTTVVTWNGKPVSSVFLGKDTRLALLPPEALATPGRASVKLESTRGLQSAPFPVPVMTGPALQSMSPPSAQAGTNGAVLLVGGEGFGDDAVIYWNDRALDTLPGPHGSETSLVATLPADALKLPGTNFVTVRRGTDGTASAPLAFQVVAAAPAPVTRELWPAVLPAGSDPVRLWVYGGGFTPRSVIRLDGQARYTTYDSGTLSTWLDTSDLSTSGVRTVTVHTPGPGGGTSLPLLLKVDARRPVPMFSGLSEMSAPAGSGELSLGVWGAGLGPYSVVRWNGEVLPTGSDWATGGYRVTVPARLLQVPGVARLTVSNPAPGGGTSEELRFVIREPGAAAIQLSPRVVEPPRDDVFLSVYGSGFTGDSYVTVDGRTVTSYLQSSTWMTARLTPEDLSTQGPLELRAMTPGEPPSAPAYLHVVGPRPPLLRGLTPGVVSVGAWAADQRRPVSLHGEGFAWFDHYSPLSDHDLATTVDWGGTPHPLRYSATGDGFHVQLGGEDVSRPGTFLMSVSRAAEGGTSSLPALLNVVAERPVPHVTAVQPATVSAGAPALRLRISGSGFHATSVVHWNDLPLPTQAWREPYAEGLEAVVPATALTQPGTAYVTVVTPEPGGGTSLPLAVWVE
ncbi:hypothetical protein [Myxococcus sp. RHSTA-1-4]|uniref:hypothetical protein n=1 Tax=Myxococcus sp. RHSTA-1-4 TaxID=2874601 RepID=UPI001CBCB94B|nr:hypothetical protein [Myxococcus sp. RHSTA-1-4]MBZ4421331.1 hypothetical protein [Myxococcus sp. RHSTA-1-4]